MKRFAVISALGGLTLLSVLVAYSGLDDIAKAVSDAGWATALVILARTLALVAAAWAWQLLLPVGQAISFGVSVLLRFIREGINQLLPVGQVGGDLIGARLATFWRVDGATAAAATVADVAIQAGTQAVFALIGVAILIALEGDTDLVRYAAGGVLLGTILIGAFFLVQAKLGPGMVGKLMRKLAGGREWIGAALAERLWRKLEVVYADRRRVVLASVIHLAVWIFGSIEVYVALHFMGYPVTVAEALVIESLGQAVRGAAFAVPGGIGVQEGGYIALCGLFGVPPGAALALSLVKRVADLVLGLPFIAVWQVLEGRRALRRSGRVSAGPVRPELAESRG